MVWFRNYRKQVSDEADDVIATYGDQAYRYAVDQARYAQRLRRTRDIRFYSEVAQEIAARTEMPATA